MVERECRFLLLPFRNNPATLNLFWPKITLTEIITKEKSCNNQWEEDQS